MKNIKKLQALMTQDQILITDTKHIEYYIDTLYHVDERFIGLLVYKDKEPKLLLNNLFMPTRGIEIVGFNDGDDITKLIQTQLTSPTLGVDGNAKLRFILPLINQATDVTDISATLNYIRAIKDDHELELMKSASTSNDAIMAQVITHLKPGITELEMVDKVIELQSQAPGSGVSFDPIVVFSENGADPHGMASDRKLQDGDTVLIDMGGMLDNYASDMTRVYFTDGNSKHKEIYDIVLAANKAAIEAIAIGVPLSKVDQAARDVITKAGYGPYFTHRTGHGIGRETHEPLDVSSSNHTIIEKGMCFSIEPGIYIKDVIGIRIEDLVCVGEDGPIVLNQAPKEFEDIVIKLQ